MLYQPARAARVRYILLGQQRRERGDHCRRRGCYGALRLRVHQRDAERFGTGRCKTFPRIRCRTWSGYMAVRRIRVVPILDFVDYRKAQAMQTVLSDELGWQDYGGKHYESIYTRFYQGHILPQEVRHRQTPRRTRPT